MEKAAARTMTTGGALAIIFTVALAVLAVFIAASAGLREISTRRIQTMTIEAIDVPKTCVSSRTRGLLRLFSPARQRSSAPKLVTGTGLYCGHIKTEYGAFTLPESHSWKFWDDNREDMFDRMKVGCRYTTIIVGHYRGFKYVFPIQNRLSRIIDNKGCRPAQAPR